VDVTLAPEVADIARVVTSAMAPTATEYFCDFICSPVQSV
jgi:hypothetical protein